MWNLVVALLILVQEPTVADLIRQLDSDKHDARENAQAALLKRGAVALKEVEAALAAAAPGELRIRLGRLIRPLRLAELTERIPSQFSEAFRAAEPALVERLKRAEPGDLIEAIAATTGKATHWEQDEEMTAHGPHKTWRVVKRDVAKGVTRADAAQVILLAIRAAPEGAPDGPWWAVRGSALQAIIPDESEDRRRLIPELMPDRQMPQVLQLLGVLVSRCTQPDDMPALLSALDLPEGDLRKKALQVLAYANPGPHAPEFEKRLASFKPPLRRWLLYPLRKSADPRFLKTFEEYMQSSEGDERIICLEALRKLAPEKLPAHFLKWIRSSDPVLVRDGLQQSNGTPWSPPVPPSADLLREARRVFDSTQDAHCRSMAFAILKRGPEDSFKKLVLEVLADGRPEVHMLGLHASSQLKGDDIRKALEKLAESAIEMSALEATSILLALPSPPSLDRVRAALKSKDPKVRSRAMYVLVAHARERAREDLVPLLEDPEPGVRHAALQHLSWNAKGLEEKIRPFLESKDEHTVLLAARALAGLGDKACLPAIRKGLEKRYDDYLPVFIQMMEPDWQEKMNVIFKIPNENATRRNVVDGIRTSFKEKGVEVVCEFPDAQLDSKAHVMGISEAGWGLNWVKTMIPQSGYFFDGKTLFILPRAEANKRWRDWINSK